MIKIDHPQVYIYSYQLSRESTNQSTSIETWANNIWQHFSPDTTPSLSTENLTPLLSKAQKFKHSDKIEGSFRFCRLDDSEGVLTRIGCPETKENKDLEIQEIEKFNPNNLMIPPSYEDWLGQTILITYKLKVYLNLTPGYLQEIADECLKKLLPESDCPPFYRVTNLFDNPIFEYSSLKGQLQVFVYLIDDTTEEKLGSILQPLFELFFHRHKITKAFIDSRRYYNLAQEFYTIIENTIENIKTEIDTTSESIAKTDRYLGELKTKLKQLLNDSLTYERTLQTLEKLDNNISIHVYNYQQKLSEIGDKCKLTAEEITTFTLFIEKVTPYFQRQIKGDLGYFKHGTDLIKTAIDVVRGIVEIEQVESDRDAEIREKISDRNLQTTIAVVGVGIGVAGVTATAFPYYLKPPDKPEKIQLFPWNASPHPITLSISISLGIGLLASVIVWGFIQFLRFYAKSKRSEKQP